jgi:polysaccharide pyruvyl transferase WcaK-like protein
MSGALRCPPATARAMEEAGAAVVLVGGYDGSGNFGDIALLDAAVALVERLGALPVPVVESVHLDFHRTLRPALEHVLVHDPGAEPEGELPEIAALYLYGGGYLNSSWGERQLAKARLALEAAPEAACVSSGWQVEPGWVEQLAPADRDVLARFAPFGVRDPLSAEALAALGPAELTGDDAVAVLPEPSGVAKQERVNVHVVEHSWVSDDPQAPAQRWLEELEKLEPRPVVQPLIAYDDPVTSERPVAERFAAACRERGFEVAEPLLLRPEAMSGAAPVMESAALTLSCSFHVALASLLLGVPARLETATGYYEQKAAGLDADAAAGVPAMRARRARVEADLTARLAAATTARARERLRHHARQTAALRAELAQLRAELQEHERRATDPWIPADARMQVDHALQTADAARAAREDEAARRRAAEARIAELEGTIESLRSQLEMVYSSRSWKLTAPLRATRPGRSGSTL